MRPGFLLVVLLFQPLTETTQGQDQARSDDPVENFEFVWRTIDRTYAFFPDRNLDWDAMYNVYRPQVTSETTPAELFDLLQRMTGHLHDGHVAIDRHDGRGQVHAHEIDWNRDFSLNLITSKYLHGKSTAELQGTLTSGWLTDGIAYLHIKDLKRGQDATCEAVDAIIQRFSDANGFIVDVRLHPGGNANTARLCANRFADRKRHCMRSRTRYGKAHDDFAPVTYNYVTPGGPLQFTRPTIVLTHRLTESGGEIFAMAMSVLPHVTIVGERTAGALGSQYPAPMPNGWSLWLPFTANLDHRGTCWNGIGLEPDVYAVNSKEDIEAGNDRVLEFAIQLLEKGQLRLQDEASSLENMKMSIVETYDRILNEKGLEAAVSEVNRLRASDRTAYFLGGDEVMVQSQRYIASGRFAEAAALLKVCVDEFPQFAGGHSMLAYCLAKDGEIEEAKAILAKAESMEIMYSFESAQLRQARRALQGSP